MSSRYTKHILPATITVTLFGGALWIGCSRQSPSESVPVTEADIQYDERVQLLRTGDVKTRGEALSSLNALIDDGTAGLSGNYVDRSLLPNLFAIAGNKNTEESRFALMTISNLVERGLPQSEAAQQHVEDFLIGVLNDSSVYVDAKSPAVNGLRHTLPLSDGNIETLFAALMNEQQPYIKREIASLLVGVAETQAVIRDRLHALVLESNIDPATQAAVTSALKFDSSAAIGTDTVLSRGLESSDPEVRWHALDAMMARFENASEADVAAISSLIANPLEPARNRVLAVEVIGRIGSTEKHPKALQTLKATALDPNNSVELRARAVRSIPFALHYSEDARTFLNQFVSQDEPDIAEAAEWGMRVVEERQQLRRQATGHN